MAPMARLGAASRKVTIALIVIGLVLLAVGIAYLPAYGLPSFLPHEESSIDPSVKQGRAAVIASVLCFLGA